MLRPLETNRSSKPEQNLVLLSLLRSEAIYLMDKVVRLDTAGPFGSEMDGASHVLTTM